MITPQLLANLSAIMSDKCIDEDWIKSATTVRCLCTDNNGDPSETGSSIGTEVSNRRLTRDIEHLPNVVIRYANRSFPKSMLHSL